MARQCLGLDEEDGGGALRGRWGRGQWRRHNSVYGLRKRTTTTRSEARVEAVVCSEAGDEATVFFRAGMKDDRQHDGV
jgi:hypothetical protein